MKERRSKGKEVHVEVTHDVFRGGAAVQEQAPHCPTMEKESGSRQQTTAVTEQPRGRPSHGGGNGHAIGIDLRARSSLFRKLLLLSIKSAVCSHKPQA